MKKRKHRIIAFILSILFIMSSVTSVLAINTSNYFYVGGSGGWFYATTSTASKINPLNPANLQVAPLKITCATNDIEVRVTGHGASTYFATSGKISAGNTGTVNLPNTNLLGTGITYSIDVKRFDGNSGNLYIKFNDTYLGKN